jgi:glycerophosphoryl diester phosphodiesterase
MRTLAIFGAVAALTGCASLALADDDHEPRNNHGATIQLGPRPFYLVDGMDDGPLKSRLMECKNGPFQRTSFSIGHRGAALQFPEHTLEAYNAGARMGAGIVECDVTFTKDRQLVCRHAQNDLHTTTNILLTPLASKCVKPFAPAAGSVPASAECRTSDLTLSEFKSLHGKMDSFDPAAKTPQEFQRGTASWRTELYAGPGTLMTMRESIRLNKHNGVKHTPELKEGDPASITATFGGQEAYAQAFANVLREEGVDPRDVYPQSFNVNDILYWIAKTPYGGQATFLIDYDAAANNILLFNRAGQQLKTRAEQMAFLDELKRAGVRILAPAMPALLAVDGDRVVASQFANDIKSLGFEIITWTFERADLRQGASKAGFYYDFDPSGAAIKKDSDMYKALDALARDVKVIGVFSDWPATVTYYANCMGLR